MSTSRAVPISRHRKWVAIIDLYTINNIDSLQYIPHYTYTLPHIAPHTQHPIHLTDLILSLVSLNFYDLYAQTNDTSGNSNNSSNNNSGPRSLFEQTWALLSQSQLLNLICRCVWLPMVAHVCLMCDMFVCVCVMALCVSVFFFFHSPIGTYKGCVVA